MATHLPILGLSRDTDPANQPENHARTAINMVHDSVDGAQGSLVNEQSNKLCVELLGNICGSIPLNRTYQIVFTDSGCIYKVDFSKCTATLLKQLQAFNFSTQYPITGEYRVVRGCEDVIYWRDSLNQDRWCNLTELEKYPERYDTVNDFALNPNISHPNVTTEVLSSGGRLEWGAYSFVIELLDEGQNTLLRTVPTAPVQIGPGLNLDNSTAEEGGVPSSNQAIRLNLTNLDTRYSYLKIAVLRSTTSDGITTDAHYVGEVVPYASVSTSYIYRGFNGSNGDFLVDADSLLVPHIVYDTSKVMEQVQGRLVRGNLTEQAVDYSQFQKYASKICTKYVVTYDEKRSEQGDEVKAYGIVYVFKNGTISPVFHIPGRGKLPHDETIIETTVVGPPLQEGVGAEITTPVTLERSGTDYTLFYSFAEDIVAGTVTLETYDEVQTIPAATSTTHVFNMTSVDDYVRLTFDVYTASGARYTKMEMLSLPFDGDITLDYAGGAGTEIQYWQLHNTSVKDATPETGSISSGKMGYYEVAAVYSNPVNFCGTDYWGSDCDGNPLLSTPIRHHRIPCRYLEPLSDNDGRARYIGVQFSNVEYPHPDIVGHYFVSSTRDETNSTVVSSGYSLPYNWEENDGTVIKEGRYIHYLPEAPDNDSFINSRYQNFISNDFLFDGKLASGDFIKINGFYQSSYEQNRKEDDDKYNNIFLKNLPYSDLVLYGKHHTATNFQPQEEFIRIEDSTLLPYKSITDEIPNRSYTSDFNLLTLEDAPSVFSTLRANLNYTYIKSNVPVHNNLTAIRYRLLSKRLHTEAQTSAIYNGDVFISKLSLTNISSVSIGGTIDTIEFAKLSIPGAGLFLFLADLLGDGDVEVKVEYEWIKNLWIESNHDLTYRHQGLDCNRWYDEDSNQSIEDFIVNKVAEVDAASDDEKRRHRLRDSMCIEWYGYNPDLSKQNTYRIFNPLSLTYNYCSNCLNSYPNRVIWSEKGFDEDISDKYRVYLPNNYFDVSAHRGEVNGLTYKQNTILVRTEESSFILQPNPQQLQADGTNVYIGTGDFLSIPPYELTSTDLGYGGQQGVLAHANTPHGLCWVDQKRGKVFLYSDTLEEVSRYKMYHYFEQNLKSFLTDDFDTWGFTPNFDQIRVAYDPKYERMLLHKTDYKFTQALIAQLEKGNVTIAGTSGKLALKTSKYGNTSEVLEWTNPVYFENKSLTISFSFRTKTWASWHSYQPHHLITLIDTFASTIDNQIWTHNDYYSFGKFFDRQYPSVVEFVDRSFITQNPHAVHYYSQVQQWVDGQWVDRNDVTFDQALIYNRNQSTGLVQLVSPPAQGTLGWSNLTKPVVQKDKVYKIAQIRDVAVAAPVNTANWNTLQQYYFDGQGWMDIAPNDNSLNLNKPMYELNELRDKYAVIRLYFNNHHKLATYLIQVESAQSVR